MQKIKDLVRAVHNKKEAFSVPKKIREISDQVLRIFQEFPEKYYGNILRNFLGKIPEKFSETSQVFFSVPQKIRKIGYKVLRISQEFPEKYL